MFKTLYEEMNATGSPEFRLRSITMEEANSGRYGRNVGQWLPSQSIPDTLIVARADTHPPGDWIYSLELSAILFPDKAHWKSKRGVHTSSTPALRLYTFYKNGYLDSVVEYPKMKRFYRLVKTMDELKAAVAVKYLSNEYT